MIKYSVCKLSDETKFIDFFKRIGWLNFNKEQVVKIQKHLSILNEDANLVLEYPYVDQTYRDSYYEYYASKHQAYPRNCVRMAIFKNDIDEDLPTDNIKFRRRLIVNFCGYVIIRPIPNRPIGRSVISPKALLNQDFVCCLAKFTIEFFGVKLTVNGFPHISQDQESITCAESSLWSIVQYYSHKYHEYTPLTPSKIRKILDDSSSKRLIPSEGLTISQISYSLSRLGFGSMIYHSEIDKQNEIKKILYAYVESGIPVIVGIENKTGTFRHAIVCIGHGLKSDTLQPQENTKTIIDVSDWDRQFIIMDDNQPPYNFLNTNDSGANYKEKHIEPFYISYVVVPLYKKIYLEYRLAKRLAKSYLKENLRLFPDLNKLVYRLFLTSSRSFKQNIFTRGLPNAIQKMIIRDSFPRFIWICEFGSYDDFLSEEISGFFIIDATGNENFDSVLFFIIGDIIKLKDKETNIQILNKEQKIGLYKNNLKGKWNKWQA